MELYQGVLKLEHKETIAQDTVELVFWVEECTPLTGGEKLKRLPFLAGQFISIQFGEKAWRAYSIASPPSEEKVKLVVRLIPGGVASEVFREARTGDTFNFKGGFGEFTLSNVSEASLVFCGTGTGIAPLRSMILTEAQSPTPRPMTLLYGGRNKEDLAYLDDLKTWAPNLEVEIGLSRDPNASATHPCAHPCRITQFLEDMKMKGSEEFYLCGGGEMVQEVQKLLLEKGIPEQQIHMERFH